MHHALILIISLALTLTACQTTQQRQKLLMDEVTQMNKDLTERKYEEHIKNRDMGFAKFKSELAKARSGVIVRERGDCCCTGADLPPVKDEKLSKAEFDSMMSILHQALPFPLLKRECVHSDYLYCATRTKNGEWTTTLKLMPEKDIIKPYWPVDKLNLLDENGECVLSIGLYYALDKASKAEMYTESPCDRDRLKALLPDDAYEHYLNHPARLRFEKAANKAEKRQNKQC